MAFAPPIHLVCVGEEEVVLSGDLGVASSSEVEGFVSKPRLLGALSQMLPS